MNPATTRTWPGAWRGLAPAALIAAGVWLVLSGGAPGSLIVGVPTILAAVWAGARLRGAARKATSPSGVDLRWSALPAFIAFYLYESMRGGLDVAGRVLSPTARLRPGFIDYPSTLRSPAAQLLFANSVSLLPGTLTADLDGARLRVHVLHLDGSPDADREAGAGSVAERDLAHLERQVARLFGESA
ncbi:MAG: Na+/H+ antiporter subunit E [Chromatiales bacterium]|nr:Na+/H+ antiporter subunit E [Gammaproteobacteria bacterium]MCP5352653.1 Na+/H+ antiporter subunit E [Chromatiales bacterium]